MKGTFPRGLRGKLQDELERSGFRLEMRRAPDGHENIMLPPTPERLEKEQVGELEARPLENFADEYLLVQDEPTFARGMRTLPTARGPYNKVESLRDVLAHIAQHRAFSPIAEGRELWNPMASAFLEVALHNIGPPRPDAWVRKETAGARLLGEREATLERNFALELRRRADDSGKEVLEVQDPAPVTIPAKRLQAELGRVSDPRLRALVARLALKHVPKELHPVLTGSVAGLLTPAARRRAALRAAESSCGQQGFLDFEGVHRERQREVSDPFKELIRPDEALPLLRAFLDEVRRRWHHAPAASEEKGGRQARREAPRDELLDNLQSGYPFTLLKTVAEQAPDPNDVDQEARRFARDVFTDGIPAFLEKGRPLRALLGFLSDTWTHSSRPVGADRTTLEAAAPFLLTLAGTTRTRQEEILATAPSATPPVSVPEDRPLPSLQDRKDADIMLTSMVGALEADDPEGLDFMRRVSQEIGFERSYLNGLLRLSHQGRIPKVTFRSLAQKLDAIVGRAHAYPYMSPKERRELDREAREAHEGDPEGLESFYDLVLTVCLDQLCHEPDGGSLTPEDLAVLLKHAPNAHARQELISRLPQAAGPNAEAVRVPDTATRKIRRP